MVWSMELRWRERRGGEGLLVCMLGEVQLRCAWCGTPLSWQRGLLVRKLAEVQLRCAWRSTPLFWPLGLHVQLL